jgi:PTS system mannose-specific IIA component
MTGLIIATHGNLAEELIRACESIIGPVSQVRAVGIRRADSVDEIRERLSGAIVDVQKEGDGVLIMTDMFGGTPANLSLAFLEPGKIEVLTGVNLPMVLKFFNTPEGLSLGERAAILKAYGQQGISLASEFLKV